MAFSHRGEDCARRNKGLPCAGSQRRAANYNVSKNAKNRLLAVFYLLLHPYTVTKKADNQCRNRSLFGSYTVLITFRKDIQKKILSPRFYSQCMKRKVQLYAFFICENLQLNMFFVCKAYCLLCIRLITQFTLSEYVYHQKWLCFLGIDPLYGKQRRINQFHTYTSFLL